MGDKSETQGLVRGLVYALKDSGVPVATITPILDQINEALDSLDAKVPRPVVAVEDTPMKLIAEIRRVMGPGPLCPTGYAQFEGSVAVLFIELLVSICDEFGDKISNATLSQLKKRFEALFKAETYDVAVISKELEQLLQSVDKVIRIGRSQR